MSGGSYSRNTFGQWFLYYKRDATLKSRYAKYLLIFNHFFCEQQAVALAHLDEIDAVIDV